MMRMMALMPWILGRLVVQKRMVLRTHLDPGVRLGSLEARLLLVHPVSWASAREKMGLGRASPHFCREGEKRSLLAEWIDFAVCLPVKDSTTNPSPLRLQSFQALG